MDSVFFIAIGGALGALGRFWTGIAVSALFRGRFPLGTFMVNVAGSFLIGLTASAIASGRLGDAPWNALVMQGLCGALTTFSTFSMDSFRLFHEGGRTMAVANVALSLILCLGAAAAGLAVFAPVQPAVSAAVHP